MKPHIVHVFPAFGGGGPEVRTAEIINQSVDRFRHSVLSLSGELNGRERLTQSDDIATVPAVYSSLWSLSQTIRSRQADLVVTYGWGGTDAIAAARLAGIRRIVHTEDGFLDDEVAQQKWKRRWARRLVFKAARLLVVPSLSLCSIARQSWRISASRLRYIPNGIDVDRFAPPTGDQKAAARRRIGLPQDGIVVGIVGAIRPEKNQLRLLQAFADLSATQPKATLLIVGDGPQMATLRQAAHDRGILQRAVFTGAVRDTTICYQAMDVLALSSDTEQMPLTVLEGMASGLPVVSTDVGDVRNMVSEENRCLVVPCDPPAMFVDALLELLKNDKRRQALGSANRLQCVSKFNWDVMLQSYLNMYEEFATGSGRPSSRFAIGATA